MTKPNGNDVAARASFVLGGAGAANEPIPPGRLALSISEVAKLIGASDRFVWGIVQSGDLRSRKSGRRVFVSVEAVREWLGDSTHEQAVEAARKAGYVVGEDRDAERVKHG